MKEIIKRPTDNPAVLAMYKKFNLKRVVEGRGHDGGGLLCDVHLRSKKLIEYRDDGWGGEAELYFEKGVEEMLQKEFDAINFAQAIFDGGYHFMKSVDRINFNLQATIFVEGLQEVREIAKTLRNAKKWLMFGTLYSYRYISWKGVKDLKDLKPGTLQRTYDKYKKELKAGQSFLNTDEQLIELGIKL